LSTDERFASNSRRTQARQELRSLILEAFSQLTAEQVIERLDAAQIANARMNDMHEVWEHAQLKERRRWVAVDTPAGQVPALLPPGLPNGYAPRMDAVPALGEQTEAILQEIGYEAGAIARLRAEHAI
jgi:crotonobetainyl-CoA:carnitine CoA-transferase CaiB-like acyl-CoA transferase